MSTLLPHAWRARLALSSLKPSSTSFATFPSISCGPPAAAAGAGIGAGAGAAGVGASPPPLPPAPVSLVGDGGWALPLMCLGSSPSDRKGTETSRLGNLSVFVFGGQGGRSGEKESVRRTFLFFVLLFAWGSNRAPGGQCCTGTSSGYPGRTGTPCRPAPAP